MPACRTAKSPTAYYCTGEVDQAPDMRSWLRMRLTSSAREASRVGSPTDPDGSVQSVGMYPKVFHAVFCLPTTRESQSCPLSLSEVALAYPCTSQEAKWRARHSEWRVWYARQNTHRIFSSVNQRLIQIIGWDTQLLCLCGVLDCKVAQNGHAVAPALHVCPMITLVSVWPKLNEKSRTSWCLHDIRECILHEIEMSDGSEDVLTGLK